MLCASLVASVVGLADRLNFAGPLFLVDLSLTINRTNKSKLYSVPADVLLLESLVTKAVRSSSAFIATALFHINL